MNLPAEARYAARPAPRLAAGLLALGVHALFVVLLVFGVSWQTQRPEPVMVDVWDALPPTAPPASAPKPAPQSKPLPPKPAPPRPEPVAKPVPAKPDIALEKKREAEHLRKMLEAEDRARAEVDRKAREKQVAEQKKREQQRQMEEEALARRMADEEAAARAEATRLAAARAAAAKRQAEASRLVGQYSDLISAKVRGNTRLPADLKGNPEVRCLVKLLPTGEVVSVRIVQSSGHPAYDDAVARAIEKSSPLPLPADREARAAFVPELSFVHRPKE